MKANETTLRQILDGSRQYVVPLFQRPYSWKLQNWKLLWSDLLDLYIYKSSEESQDVSGHFFGPIVTQDRSGSPTEVTSYILIDGQQRLTTLSILLAALRDHYRACHDQEGIVADKLHDFLTNRFTRGEKSFKVLPTQIDRTAYKEVVDCQSQASSGLIWEAYQFFLKSIQEAEKNQDVRLNIEVFSNLILSSVNLVSIFLDKSDDPYLIYESLNYKGEPLSQADLIRNHLFMRLPAGQHDQIYADKWLPIEQRFKGNAGNDYLKEMTNAFWYYLRKSGQPINQKLIYQNLKQEIDKSPDSGVETKLDDLLRFSGYYLRIHFPQQEEKNQDLRYWFEHLSELKLTSFYSFILRIYDDYEKGKITVKDFCQILEILESYAIRRWIVDVPSGPLNKTFIALYQQIEKTYAVVNPKTLRAKLASFDRTQRWPTDEELRAKIIERPLYVEGSDGKKRIKFVLQRLQEKLSKELVSFDNLNIEHILPQTMTDEWRAVLGEKADEIHRQWSDVLGNLTMVVGSDNSEMSNRSFETKLKFLKTSNLSINKYFYDLSKWDHHAIQKRGEWLADQAIKVWPR